MITRMLKTLWQVERAGIATTLDRCCHTIHQRSTCTRCVDACPTGALVFDEGLKLDLGRCRECGACATACPTAALEARNPTDDQLLVEMRRAVAAGRPVVFACLPKQSEAAEQIISVPCLSRVDESLLFAALALGAPGAYLLSVDCCQCRSAGARAAAEAVVGRVNALLADTPLTDAIRFVDELPSAACAAVAAAPGPSRRDFLRLISRQAARVGSESVAQWLGEEPVEPPTGRAAQLPAKRQLLLAAWRKLGYPVPPEFDSAQLWARLRVADACNGCQMCARFCPTGALRVETHAGGADLTFAPALCVDCGLCRDACYLHANSLEHTSDPRDLDRDMRLLLYERRPSPWVRGVNDDRLTNAVRETLRL